MLASRPIISAFSRSSLFETLRENKAKMKVNNYAGAILLASRAIQKSASHHLTRHASPPVQEEQNRGKPNWEHLNDELHVLITVEDCENRAKLKLERAVEEVKKLLTVVSVYQRLCLISFFVKCTFCCRLLFYGNFVAFRAKDSFFSCPPLFFHYTC